MEQNKLHKGAYYKFMNGTMGQYIFYTFSKKLAMFIQIYRHISIIEKISLYNSSIYNLVSCKFWYDNIQNTATI